MKGSNKHLARVYAVQMTYQMEINPEADQRAAWDDFWKQQKDPEVCTDEIKEFAETLASGTCSKKPEIDAKIKEHLQNWSFERVALIDLSILRVALHEMLHRNDIPPVVSIDEAIEIAKEYGAEDSYGFINGILDKVRSELLRPARSPAAA